MLRSSPCSRCLSISLVHFNVIYCASTNDVDKFYLMRENLIINKLGPYSLSILPFFEEAALLQLQTGEIFLLFSSFVNASFPNGFWFLAHGSLTTSILANSVIDGGEVVSCPDYFSHAEGKNSLVNCLFNFCSMRFKNLLTQRLQKCIT